MTADELVYGLLARTADPSNLSVPALQRVQSPSAFRMGSHVSGFTRIIDIGYMLGISLDTKPMAPNVLSVLAGDKKKQYTL